MKRPETTSPTKVATNLGAKRAMAMTPAQGQVETQPAQATEKLHKVLARAGLGSRRLLEQWIEQGRVLVNGRAAVVADRVGPHDRVEVDGRLQRLNFALDEARVLLYHKPPGEIVSRSDPSGRPTVFDRLPPVRNGRWVAVGRLDFNTSGLLLFTDSGDLADGLMHPSTGLEREYAVRVFGTVSDEQRRRLLTGVQLDDGKAKFETIESGGGTGTNRWYNVTLREGRNREVRRMFGAAGLTVSRLIRVRYGPVSLPPRLLQGHAVLLPGSEVAVLQGLIAGVRKPREEGVRPPG